MSKKQFVVCYTPGKAVRSAWQINHKISSFFISKVIELWIVLEHSIVILRSLSDPESPWFSRFWITLSCDILYFVVFFRIGYRLNAIKYIFRPFIEKHFLYWNISFQKQKMWYLPINRYWKTEQSTVNHNIVQKRKWDTFCILTVISPFLKTLRENEKCKLLVVNDIFLPSWIDWNIVKFQGVAAASDNYCSAYT